MSCCIVISQFWRISINWRRFYSKSFAVSKCWYPKYQVTRAVWLLFRCQTIFITSSCSNISQFGKMISVTTHKHLKTKTIFSVEQQCPINFQNIFPLISIVSEVSEIGPKCWQYNFRTLYVIYWHFAIFFIRFWRLFEQLLGKFPIRFKCCGCYREWPLKYDVMLFCREKARPIRIVMRRCPESGSTREKFCQRNF